LACYVESSGVAPSRFAGALGARAGFYEAAAIRVEPDGAVRAMLGTHNHGQGHATSFAQILSSRLGVAVGDIEIIEGDTDRVAYDPPSFAFSNGAHVCELEIDPETGRTAIVGYWAVDDIGTVINPIIVHGQLHGGVAQGMGQALLERCAYDREGQLVSGSFMDYAVPRANDLPLFVGECHESQP